MTLPFIGTAAQALQQTRKAIAEARKTHAPVKHLLDRERLLVARCAALGANDG